MLIRGISGCPMMMCLISEGRYVLYKLLFDIILLILGWGETKSLGTEAIIGPLYQPYKT
jgi:hypothetical protein